MTVSHFKWFENWFHWNEATNIVILLWYFSRLSMLFWSIIWGECIIKSVTSNKPPNNIFKPQNLNHLVREKKQLIIYLGLMKNYFGLQWCLNWPTTSCKKEKMDKNCQNCLSWECFEQCCSFHHHYANYYVWSVHYGYILKSTK